jgi:hypothetical protein
MTRWKKVAERTLRQAEDSEIRLRLLEEEKNALLAQVNELKALYEDQERRSDGE